MDEMASKQLIGQKEEITDILTPDGVRSGDFKRGQVLKFDYEGTITCIKITRLDKKNGRAWGQHVELVNFKQGIGHYGHLIDTTDTAIRRYGVPFCEDCGVPINQEATPAGEAAFQERAEHTLEDGTVIHDDDGISEGA